MVGGLGLLLILAGVGWALYGVTTWTLGSGLLADTVGLWAWILYYGFPGLGATSVGMWLLAPGLMREHD